MKRFTEMLCARLPGRTLDRVDRSARRLGIERAAFVRLVLRRACDASDRRDRRERPHAA